MQNPAYDLRKLEQHLVSGGSAVICTDQVDAWQETALVAAFPSAVKLIPLERGECARHVLAALDAYLAAGTMSVRVIIEGVDREAYAPAEDILQQIGCWTQQTTVPKGMAVAYVLQPRSRSHEEMGSLLDAYRSHESSQN